MGAESDSKSSKAPEQSKQASVTKGKDAKKKRKGEEDKDADLSEEDLELKQNLELLVERIKDSSSGVQSNALQVTVHRLLDDASTGIAQAHLRS